MCRFSINFWHLSSGANNQIGVNVTRNTTSAAWFCNRDARDSYVDYTGTSPTGTFTDTISNNTVTVTNSTLSTFEMNLPEPGLAQQIRPLQSTLTATGAELFHGGSFMVS